MHHNYDKDVPCNNVGPYDELYRAAKILWPSEPGRMVRRASQLARPGVAVDAGCGDGKNAKFLAELGWRILAFDVSQIALRSFRRRAHALGGLSNVQVVQGSASEGILHREEFDLVVCYGLYHCLTDKEVLTAHKSLTDSLRPGGLFAYSAFNDLLPVPAFHCTGTLYLRSSAFIFELMRDWQIEEAISGTIQEDHSPLVPFHSHSVTWGLFRKPLR